MTTLDLMWQTLTTPFIAGALVAIALAVAAAWYVGRRPAPVPHPPRVCTYHYLYAGQTHEIEAATDTEAMLKLRAELGAKASREAWLTQVTYR